MSELKPCPFCGGVAKVFTIYNVSKYHINCANKECGCVFIANCETEQEAIEAWNRRTGNVPTEFHEKIVNAQANRWIKRNEEIERESREWERKYWDLAKSIGGDPNEDGRT